MLKNPACWDMADAEIAAPGASWKKYFLKNHRPVAQIRFYAVTIKGSG